MNVGAGGGGGAVAVAAPAAGGAAAAAPPPAEEKKVVNFIPYICCSMVGVCGNEIPTFLDWYYFKKRFLNY